MTLKQRARGALREPLVHFLLGGLLIFVFFAWRGEEADPASRLIAVDRETQAQIALTFERTMQRPPTDQELDGLIEQWVREEVLYREALRLGLDADDPIVRRRLAKKMDFLAASSAEAAAPDETELENWYQANAARYAQDSKLSFDQVYFASADDAESLQGRIGENWRDLGDPVSLPKVVEGQGYSAVSSRFGRAFAARLLEMKPGTAWTGPVSSGLGWHYVRLRQREDGSVPTLDSQRERVMEDWRIETAKQREEQAYQLLREAYKVEISER